MIRVSERKKGKKERKKDYGKQGKMKKFRKKKEKVLEWLTMKLIFSSNGLLSTPLDSPLIASKVKEVEDFFTKYIIFPFRGLWYG